MAKIAQFPLSDYHRLAENYRADNPQRAPVVDDPNGKYGVIPHDFQSPDGRFWQVEHRDGRGVEERSGWKFHVSFHPEDMPKAWALASQHLMDKDVKVFKVASPITAQKFSDPNSIQAGKFITVYETGNAGDLANTMGELEQIFARNGIRPGPDVRHDRKVPGSQYLSYRNDKNTQGQYISSRELASAPPQQAYNVAGHPDPWQGFRMISPPPMEHVQTTLANELQQSLNHYLPGAPVQQTQWNGQGYTVAVPETYSRQQFGAAGFDPASLKRHPIGNGIHLVHIPANALDARFDPVKTRAGMTNFVNLNPAELWKSQAPQAARQMPAPSRGGHAIQ